MKLLTREQAESRKAKAVQFLRDVVNDDDRADEVDAEPLEEYAERRHITLANPAWKGTRIMSVDTKSLQRRIKELEEENEDLQTKLDDIADLVMPEEDEEEEDNQEDYED